MRKFTILFDADDTVEDLLECWLRALNATHGTAIEKNDVIDWNVASFFPSLTEQDVYTPLYNKRFWKDLLPITGAAKNIQKLKNDGHTLYMVTASNYQTAEPKITKLLELFPFLDWDHIILAKNKQMVKGDILIDDGPHNLVGGEYTKFLFDRPHNHSFDEKANGVKRFYTWDDIYKEICKMAEE